MLILGTSVTRISLDKSVLLSMNAGLSIMLILTATIYNVNNPGIDLTSRNKNWKNSHSTIISYTQFLSTIFTATE